MKKLVLILVAALAPCVAAHADIPSGTPLYAWTQPTTWSDGAPLTAAQIVGYQRVCNGNNLARIAAASGVPPYQTPVAERLAPGAYSCTLAVVARRTPTDPEVVGLPSNAISFTVPQPRPNAATGFSAE